MSEAAEAAVQGAKFGLSPQAEKRIDGQIQMLHPKMAQAKQISAMLDPSACLDFSLTLKAAEFITGGKAVASADDVEIRITVTNPATSQSIALSETEFLTCFSLLNDDLGHMRDAVTHGGEYTIPTENRPAVRFFDHMIHLGTCVLFTEILQYNMDTDPEESYAKIFNVAPGMEGHVDAGKLEVIWTPLAGPDDNGSGEIMEIDDAQAFLGKPWTYRLQIKQAVGLPSSVHETYIEYSFFGERFHTEVQEYEKGTRSPDFAYSFVHHVASVSREFLDFLSKPLELRIFTTPYVFFPPTGISTRDPGVAERVCPGAVATGAVSRSDEAELVAAKNEARELRKQVSDIQSKANLEVTELRAELAKLRMNKRIMSGQGAVQDPAMKMQASSRSTEQVEALPNAVPEEQPGPDASELERTRAEARELHSRLARIEDQSAKEKLDLQKQLQMSQQEMQQLQAQVQRLEAENKTLSVVPGGPVAPKAQKSSACCTM